MMVTFLNCIVLFQILLDLSTLALMFVSDTWAFILCTNVKGINFASVAGFHL